MFSTLTAKILLAFYIFLILSIPAGSYLISQKQTVKVGAGEEKKAAESKPTPSPASQAKKLQQLAEKKVLSESPKPSPTPSDQPTTTVATSFGPTLSVKVSLEGRPKDNQKTSLFIGISEGAVTLNPKFILSFTVDLPTSGEYSNLSLAGLTPGSNYTALLKGTAQIATSSAFLMSATVTNLNSGQQILLLSGDLNDDNLINSADYSIAKKAYGSTAKSSNWNENTDFNKDGTINSVDLSFIVKNFGKSGASAAWVSPVPKSATPSGALVPVGSQGGTSSGYWIWVPR